MNGKRAPSRNGGARPAGSPAVDALAPAGKKKVLKQLGGPDSAPSPPTRLLTANGAPKVLPPPRADMLSKALAEMEPEEKSKKLKSKKAPGAEGPRRTSTAEDGQSSPLLHTLRALQDGGRDSEAKTSAGMMQALVKRSSASTRVNESGGGAAGGRPDRSNPSSIFQPGSGGDRVGPSILAGLKAGSLTQPPSKKLPAPKTGPWRKIMIPTPQHIEWRAPMEYGFAVGGGGRGGTWASFDDEVEQEPVVEIPPDQLDPTADLVGEEVYNDGMAPDDEELALLSQCPAHKDLKKSDRSRKWRTPPLRFESRFESGNLRKAIRRGETEYTLFMRDDVCSMEQGKEVPHCAQWFYFQVLNAIPNTQYLLSIVNFVKPESMYTDGMRPLFYSRIEEKKNAKGWFRVGDNIQYFPNSRKFSKGSSYQHYHSLKFCITFPHADDECYLAMCYPYTYTDVKRHIRELSCCPQRSKLFTLNEFCRTTSGNILDLLLIGAHEGPKDKPALILTGRVHPGESNASFMMHGMLEFLLSPSQYASELRKNFLLYVVPMLNPDGVILGNYRCNLSGHDLNRAYPEPDAALHPEICTVKKLARELAGQQRLALFLDMHGHSSKKGFFLYCCDESVMAFPANIQKRSAFYSMDNTTYKIGKAKATTGRAVIHNPPIGIKIAPKKKSTIIKAKK